MVDFDDAPRAFSRLLIEALGSEEVRVGRIVRDIYGRLSFITPHPRDERFEELQHVAAQTLGAYGQAPLIISASAEEAGPGDLFKERSISVSVDGKPDVRMVDRRLAGDDWLTRPTQIDYDSKPRRLLFYSIKGGVGRSTALAIAAADLAAQGHNVLALDLDLEGPGLGALLLTPDEMPKYGAIDWFAAVAAGAETDAIIADMTGPSPFTSARAIVDVVPANGRDPGMYLSKLARAYAPGSLAEKYRGDSFVNKADALIDQLASHQRYDVILIDARSGLHETSGGLILGLGAKSLLFGIDTPQTFDGFRLLFSAFAQALDPALDGEDLRSAFKMVHAKAPRDERDRRLFRERSWGIWSDYLYDDVDPITELSGSGLVFDLNEEDAPHYPLEIIGEETYARFDPQTETYPMSVEAYRPVFGNFLGGVRSILSLTL